MDDNQNFSITMDETAGNAVSLIVSGRVDAVNSAVLGSNLEKALGGGHINITVNMSGVRFLSSMGIRAILKAYKTAKELGGALHITSPSEIVKNVMGMTALDEMLLD